MNPTLGAPHDPTCRPASWHGERGVALPLALMVLLLLAALSVAILATGASETRIATNVLRGAQAFYLAEAGLEEAFNWFRTDLTRLDPSLPPAWTPVPTAGPGSDLAAYGTYGPVEYRAAGGSGSRTVEVRSTGTTVASAVGGAGQRVLRAIFTTNFVSTDAIRTKETLTVSGNPGLRNACGSIHSNGDLLLNVTPGTDSLGVPRPTAVEGNATATGSYTTTGSGTASIAGLQAPHRPSKPIPTVAVSQVRDAALARGISPIVLRSNPAGTQGFFVENSVETAVADGASYNHWTFRAGTPATWEVTGTAPPDGTYYVEGHAVIKVSPGTGASPWTATILATGSIDVQGAPRMTPHLADTLLVSGGDIKLGNNAQLGTSAKPGLVAANEQIEVSGAGVIVTVFGSIVAADASHANPLVAHNTVSAHINVFYRCGLNPPLRGQLAVVAWGL
jgi:hypothetical protein